MANKKPNFELVSAQKVFSEISEKERSTQSLSEHLLSCIESIAREVLSSVELPSPVMTITEDSFFKILHAPEFWLDENEDSFQFEGSTETCGFHLGLHVKGSINEEGVGDLDYETTLIYWTDDIAARYNFETNEWQEDKALKQVIAILSSNDARADYITELADTFQADPLGINAEILLQSIETHKPLIRLYETLHGLAAYSFEVDSDNNIRPMLIPDDPLRSGSAVFYENGRFRGCQYLSVKDSVGIFLDIHDAGDLIDLEKEDMCLNHEVFCEKSARKTASYLRHWWDRYSPDFCYSLPLSGSAVILTDNPYRKIPHAITQHGRRELTPAETKELEKLRKHFQ